MAATSRRAVLTGLGVVSPIGIGADTFWRALLAGTSGIRPIRTFDASTLPCPIAGEILDFDGKKLVAKDVRKSLKVMARTIQLGVAAAQLAMDDGKFQKGQIDPFRFGIEFGCVMVASELEDLVKAATVSTDSSANSGPPVVDLDKWGQGGIREVPPLWMLKYLPNMPACHVSVTYDAQGPNNTITAGDAAALLALGEALRIMQRNLADAFLVGGCDSRMNPLSMSRHNTFQPLTKKFDPAEKASRPFDAARDGIVLGEAATVVLLEDLEFARKRGATIQAELVGFASGFDRGRSGTILAKVIRNALKESGIGPADVDHVNAAASGSPELDAFEARAIAEVFGDSVPVFAPKGHFGNTGAACGLVELAASVLALRRGELPGTLNCDTRAADCPVNVHTGAPRAVVKPYAVKVTYTDMGQCAVVVLKRWEES
ncbi:beta-ketoacyl-[acyl-carrier-protein] synthase family protein [Fimbriiglobus ruber]|uniref:3-oxoacyl-[acyl-carrier-protein] synthase, KASII n=1 Tax=Fimbriiglobus ruber TaxID=1908690 RepID=A0A225DP62_9BACT|nr:beta-ketoacyl-[acyl-carrier-protein] synthase family protein [Fimbriiglobus ruber]OWK38145.1 3-oxoacyl-[acyl-carrier-protein] synthase, KASII [Fimbriiglobus ruber]